MLGLESAWCNEELLARLRRGDAQARAEFIAAIHPSLLSRIRLMLGERARRFAESSDFVNGAVLQALKQVDQPALRSPRDLLAWITAAARNDIRDHVDKRREQALESLSQSWDHARAADSRGASPLSAAERKEQVERLVEKLEELDPDQQTVVELRNIEELSFAQIGARLGWSDDRARLTHMRAMVRLGQLLGREPV